MVYGKALLLTKLFFLIYLLIWTSKCSLSYLENQQGSWEGVGSRIKQYGIHSW